MIFCSCVIRLLLDSRPIPGDQNPGFYLTVRSTPSISTLTEEQSSNAVVLYNLGFLLAEQGRNDEARPLLLKAKEVARDTSLERRTASLLRRLDD